MPFAAAVALPEEPQIHDCQQSVVSALEFLNPGSSAGLCSSEAENHGPISGFRDVKMASLKPVDRVRQPKRVSFLQELAQPDVTEPRTPLFNAAVPRSILKPSAPLLMSEEVTLSFSSMLETVRAQLAGEDTALQIEGYGVLHRRLSPLSKYLAAPDGDEGLENTEDESIESIMAALKANASMYSSFFLRDMGLLKDPKAESRLPMQAMKAMLSYVRIGDVGDAFASRFYATILNVMIATLDRPGNVQKFVAKSVVLVLDCVCFRPQVIPRDQYRPLLEAMQRLRTVKSNGISGIRLSIFSSLVLENVDIMSSASHLWIVDMFEGFTNPIADVRVRAIRLAEIAGCLPSKNTELAKSVNSFFRQYSVRGTVYFTFFLDELRKMIKSPSVDVRRDVPRIWAATILLLRRSVGGVDKTLFFKPLLSVLQSCFNAADSEIRVRSFISLNALVYSIMPTEKTDRAVRRLLKLPVIEKVVSSPPQSENVANRRTWQAAMLAYTNILHYAFRPNMSNAGYQLFWEEYVWEPCSRVGQRKDPTSIEYMCRILSELIFHDETTSMSDPASWREERAVVDLSVEGMSCLPEELPALPPAWIRANLDRVLAAIECFVTPEGFSISYLSVLPQSTEMVLQSSPVLILWRRVVSAVVAAAAREVRPTQESHLAFVKLTEFIDTVWQKYRTQIDEQNAPLFVAMVVHFADLWKNSSFVLPMEVSWAEGEFAPSPLSRFAKHISDIPPLEPEAEDLLDSLVAGRLEAAIPGLSRVQFLAALADAIQAVVAYNWVSPRRRDAFLKKLVTRVAVAGCQQSGWRAGAASEVRKQFAPLVRAVSTAASYLDEDTLTSFYHLLRDTAFKSGGDAGAILGLVEPLAQHLIQFERPGDMQNADHLTVLALVMMEAEAGQTIDAARVHRARLESSSQFESSPSQSMSSRRLSWMGSDKTDPYTHFYKLIEHVLNWSRLSSFSSLSHQTRVLKSVSTFIRKVSVGYGIFSHWSDLIIQFLQISGIPSEKDGQTNVQNEVELELVRLWTALCETVERFSRFDADSLHVLSPLFVAGLHTHPTEFGPRFVTMWQRTYDDLDQRGKIDWSADFAVLSELVLKAKKAAKEHRLTIESAPTDRDGESERKPDFPVSATGTPLSLKAHLQARSHSFSPADYTAIISSPVKGKKHSDGTDEFDEQAKLQLVNSASGQSGGDYGRLESPTPAPRALDFLELCSSPTLHRLTVPVDPSPLSDGSPFPFDLTPVTPTSELHLDIPSSPPEVRPSPVLPNPSREIVPGEDVDSKPSVASADQSDVTTDGTIVSCVDEPAKRQDEDEDSDVPLVVPKTKRSRRASRKLKESRAADPSKKSGKKGVDGGPSSEPSLELPAETREEGPADERVEEAAPVVEITRMAKRKRGASPEATTPRSRKSARLASGVSVERAVQVVSADLPTVRQSEPVVVADSEPKVATTPSAKQPKPGTGSHRRRSVRLNPGIGRGLSPTTPETPLDAPFSRTTLISPTPRVPSRHLAAIDGDGGADGQESDYLSSDASAPNTPSVRKADRVAAKASKSAGSLPALAVLLPQHERKQLSFDKVPELKPPTVTNGKSISKMEALASRTQSQENSGPFDGRAAVSPRVSRRLRGQAGGDAAHDGHGVGIADPALFGSHHNVSSSPSSLSSVSSSPSLRMQTEGGVGRALSSPIRFSLSECESEGDFEQVQLREENGALPSSPPRLFDHSAPSGQADESAGMAPPSTRPGGMNMNGSGRANPQQLLAQLRSLLDQCGQVEMADDDKQQVGKMLGEWLAGSTAHLPTVAARPHEVEVATGEVGKSAGGDGKDKPGKKGRGRKAKGAGRR